MYIVYAQNKIWREFYWVALLINMEVYSQPRCNECYWLIPGMEY